MDVVVVGSCMIDIISYVERFPKAGETLHGSEVEIGFGGKGANQCVMASRLNAKTAMVAKVGVDTFGNDYINNFKKNGIDISHVQQTDKALSGIATICVEKSGQNNIVIVGGANNLLTTDDVRDAADVISGAKVLICQLEVPVSTSLEAMKLARQAGVLTIFNPAPGARDLDTELFKFCDICCPNETEAELLTSVEVTGPESAGEACRVLHARGCNVVIITLGSQGAFLSRSAGAHTGLVPLDPVTAVDTTGAGDAFLGSLAYFLSTKKSPLADDLYDCVSRACRVATISVQKRGTQTSFPKRDQLPPDLFD